MATIQQLIQYLENLAPAAYQEGYDNAGLIAGNPQEELKGVLISLDSTEDVVEEALQQNCNMIVAHHPIVFKGLKKLNGKNYVERTVIKALKNDIALYAIHTNLDNVKNGVNWKIAEKIGLKDVKILAPKAQTLTQLTTFVPPQYTQELLDALGKAGAGQIGEYRNCSFRVQGIEVFEPTENARPHTGQPYRREELESNRVEVIFPSYLRRKILQTLHQVHPYEEVAYYLQALENVNQEVGAGAVGVLPEKMEAPEFLAHLKDKMELTVIRHTAPLGKPIQKVAVCGGAGSFLLSGAIRQRADIFITADYKYHEFFDADQQIMIADIGHYESEVFTKDLLFEKLTQNFAEIKIQRSKVVTNPIHYFT